jgi:dihydroorotate dehydrogenase electron transfer subunit
MPVQVRGEILDVKRAGAYHVITLTAGAIPAQARPGQFVAVGIGGGESALLLRRAIAIHRVSSRGVYGGTLEIVVAVHGEGTRWLANRRRRDPVDVVGPLGRPFSLPRDPVNCVLVAGGYGSSALAMLIEELRGRGSRVDVVIGASTEDRLFGVLDAKRLASSVTITTDDGSAGQRGRVTDVLPDVLERCSADVVYACGPMPMLSAVAAAATEFGIVSQCAVEESMACGIGVCMTCVLPVIGDDGVTRMVRSCVEGPIFRGDRVRWSEVGTVPADTYGATPLPEEAR